MALTSIYQSGLTGNGKSSSLRTASPASITLGGNSTVVTGGFRYHVFTSSGALAVVGNRPIDAEVLLISGGGGAGHDRSGGGGAGAIKSVSKTLIPGPVFIVVGAGGAGGIAGLGGATNGGTSMVSNVTQPNLVTNPSFETNADNWLTYNGNSVARTTSVALFGSGSLQITSANASGSDVYQSPRSITFQIGDTFTYSAYFRNGTSNRTCFVAAYALNSSFGIAGEYKSANVTPDGSGWTRASVTFTVPANTFQISLNLQTNAGSTGTTFVDGVMLQRSATLNTFVDSTIAASDYPLYLYDSIIGGGSGGGWAENGANGSSGGGGGGVDDTTRAGGLGTSGLGFNGGSSFASPGVANCAGGGGGAGGAGANATSTTMGAGGIGTNAFSTWATATGTGQSGYYCGGGSGGCDSRNGSAPTTLAGGLGGGGTGQKFVNGSDGTANTGGGGGGSGITFSPSLIQRNGGNGGSGLVIVRVAA